MNGLWKLLSKVSIFGFALMASNALIGLAMAESAPLDPGWNYKLGVEERFRYEYKHNFDFNDELKDNGSLFYNRVRLNVKAVLADQNKEEKVLFFVEGMDAQTGGYQIKPVATQRDDFDFHQGYVTFSNLLDSDIDLSLGRRELHYGKDRLITNTAFSNLGVPDFDAAVLHYHKNGFYGDLLYAQYVKYDDNNFDHSSSDEFISGTYLGYQKDKTSPQIEWYFLPQVNARGVTTIHRYTVGARFQTKLCHDIFGEIEVPYQFGEQGDKEIRAYAVSAVLWRDFPAIAGKPKVSLEYDQASGDQDPNDNQINTFNPLYPSSHTPYGIIDFFRWQNMREGELSVAFSVTDKLKVIPQTDFFWLESINDSWYNSSGTALRTQTSGERGYYVGNETSLRAIYDLTKTIKLEGGYAHFFPGEYVKNTGSGDAADWIYSQILIKY